MRRARAPTAACASLRRRARGVTHAACVRAAARPARVGARRALMPRAARRDTHAWGAAAHPRAGARVHTHAPRSPARASARTRAAVVAHGVRVKSVHVVQRQVGFASGRSRSAVGGAWRECCCQRRCERQRQRAAADAAAPAARCGAGAHRDAAGACGARRQQRQRRRRRERRGGGANRRAQSAFERVRCAKRRAARGRAGWAAAPRALRCGAGHAYAWRRRAAQERASQRSFGASSIRASAHWLGAGEHAAPRAPRRRRTPQRTPHTLPRPHARQAALNT
jgi:hypothetical protein